MQLPYQEVGSACPQPCLCPQASLLHLLLLTHLTPVRQGVAHFTILNFRAHPTLPHLEHIALLLPLPSSTQPSGFTSRFLFQKDLPLSPMGLSSTIQMLLFFFIARIINVICLFV